MGVPTHKRGLGGLGRDRARSGEIGRAATVSPAEQLRVSSPVRCRVIERGVWPVGTFGMAEVMVSGMGEAQRGRGMVSREEGWSAGSTQATGTAGTGGGRARLVGLLLDLDLLELDKLAAARLQVQPPGGAACGSKVENWASSFCETILTSRCR